MRRNAPLSTYTRAATMLRKDGVDLQEYGRSVLAYLAAGEYKLLKMLIEESCATKAPEVLRA